MSDFMKQIKLKLLTEATNIEALFNGDSLYLNPHCELKTDELVIHYKIKGEDHFLTVNETDICKLMKQRAIDIRLDLARFD